MRVQKLPVLALAIALCASTMAMAADDEPSEQVKRMGAAADVLNELMGTPDKGIPEEILSSAECIAVVPSMIKIGLVFGGRHGRGVTVCRTKSGWSAPAPFTITGGSWGLQVGGEAVDLVMLAMNDKGMQDMLASKFKIGADASAAAGPVGRHVEGETDWKMRAQVLTYSRARGIFAGITLNGASITQDKDGTRILYGRMIPSSQLLKGKVGPPEGSQRFMAAVKKYAGEASAEASNHEPKRSTASSETPHAMTSTEAEHAIKEKLKDEPDLASKDIDVSLTAGTVKLSGSVDSEYQRDKAVEIAKSFAGHREVQDQLTIQPR